MERNQKGIDLRYGRMTDGTKFYRKGERKGSWAQVEMLVLNRRINIHLLKQGMNDVRMNMEGSGQDGRVGKSCLPLFTTTLKLQLNYRATITEHHLKSSCTVLQLRTYRRYHVGTSGSSEDVE